MAGRDVARVLPENLTHCSECGQPFGKPVQPEEAAEWFPSVEAAAFSCRTCSSEWGPQDAND